MPSLHSPKAEVLIVDDEVQTRELLSEFCRTQGYTVAKAHDGRAALTATTSADLSGWQRNGHRTSNHPRSRESRHPAAPPRARSCRRRAARRDAAGSASTVAPYAKPASGPVSAYAGSTQEMEVDIHRNRSVKVGVDGRQIAQGGDASDIFAAFDALIAAVRAGDDAGIGQGMDALQRMFDRVSIVQGRVGSDLRTLDEQSCGST